MSKFKLNKKYNHKATLVAEAFHISEERENFILNKIIDYWESLSPKQFMISKILDFVEQQDWTIIEKLYASERFTSIHTEEEIFGGCNEELMDYIIKNWTEKGTVSDEEETREYLKHMFKLLSGYNLECLIDTLKNIDNLGEEFEKINPNNGEEEDEIIFTPEQIEEKRKSSLMNNALLNIDKAIPDSFGVVVFGKNGYDIIGKTPEMTKLIQETIQSGQNNFIAKKEVNLDYYQ